MTRLDDLRALRDELDREIEAEEAAGARHTALMLRTQTMITRGSWDTRVFSATCAYFRVDGDAVLGPNRGSPQVLRARQVAMWLMRQANRSYPEIARQMERDHSTVIKACRRVEQDQQSLAAASEIYSALTGEQLTRTLEEPA